MKVIGIHDGHNASVSLVSDGRLVRVLQEERYSRVKNKGGFPKCALQEMLSLAALAWRDVNIVAYSTICFRNDRMANRDEVYAVFQKLFAGNRFTEDESRLSDLARDCNTQRCRRIARLRQAGYGGEVVFVDHHTCHASAAYYGTAASNEESLVFTCDGQGDGLSGTVSVGLGSTLRRIAAISRDDSVAQLYSYFTYILGFVPLEHEYKLMGLAPYAESSKRALDFAAWLASLFDLPTEQPTVWRRRPGVPRSELMPAYLAERVRFMRFDEVAGGLQIFFETFLADWVRRAVQSTGISRIALGGGGFMNVKLNGRLAADENIDDVQIFPSCGDESNSVGAALHVAAAAGEPAAGGDTIYFGRVYTDAQCLSAAKEFCETLDCREPSDIEAAVATLLSQGEIVARFSGGAEFGARALGNRSILVDPRRTEAVAVLNDAIKCRDFWMPFAATVLDSHAYRLLKLGRVVRSPHMMFAFPIKEPAISVLPAAMHPRDKTCRAQILTESDNPSYFRLINFFYNITGVPCLLNTSCNLHGEPIVEDPRDAVRVFKLSGLKYLALGPYLLVKRSTNS